VRVGGVKLQPFAVGVGLRPGCVLPPLLFLVYISVSNSGQNFKTRVSGSWEK